MAKGKTEIDGYTVFKAARKANEAAKKKQGGKKSKKPEAEEQQDPAKSENMVRAATKSEGTKRGEAPGSRIGRTAMPSKNVIICYHCGHSCEIIGKQANTICPNPKCRERLDLTDTKVSAEGWRKNITTAGDLVVNMRGVVVGGEIIANNVVVKGKIKGGTIKANHQLRIHPGGEVDFSTIEASVLVIQKGVELKVEDDLSRFENIEVHGSLQGDIKPGGNFVLHKTGSFTGSIQTKSLDIRDGGILEADLKLGI